MREYFVAMALLLAGVADSAQVPNARPTAAHEWKVTVVETAPLPPLQISDPTLRVVTDVGTHESHVELSFVATNVTDAAVTTDLSVWLHEFGPDGSWLFDALDLTTTPSTIGPQQRRRIRSVYRGDFDRRDGTWILLSLKSAKMDERKWEQSDPWKRAVAVWRGQASPALEDLPYDEFMDLEPGDRRAVFNYVSADGKERLMRTQLDRFLAANAHSLTREQRVFVEDAIAALSPDFYTVPRSTEAEAAARELASRARLLFTTSEWQQCFTLDGPKLPRVR